jgi:hypothetical protein
LEIEPEELWHIHFALYLMKDWLKQTKDISRAKKRARRRQVNRMIMLVDLLLGAA